MHQSANSERYCLNCLPDEPFSLKDFLITFCEVFGPKNTADSHHNCYADFRQWCSIKGKPQFTLQGRRGSRFSWASRNARFLLMHRADVVEFCHLAVKEGNRHAGNHRMTKILDRIENHWPFIFSLLGSFTVMWTYLVKNLFAKFSKTTTLGQLREDCKKIRETVGEALGAENPLHELTVLNEKLFPDSRHHDEAISFSTIFMEAVAEGQYEDYDLNPFYQPVLDYIDTCLRQIHSKLGRDDTLVASQNDDCLTTPSNQYAESLFAVMKLQDLSLQSTSKSGRFQVS